MALTNINVGSWKVAAGPVAVLENCHRPHVPTLYRTPRRLHDSCNPRNPKNATGIRRAVNDRIVWKHYIFRERAHVVLRDLLSRYNHPHSRIQLFAWHKTTVDPKNGRSYSRAAASKVTRPKPFSNSDKFTNSISANSFFHTTNHSAPRAEKPSWKLLCRERERESSNRIM